jgi:hypothetical protein
MFDESFYLDLVNGEFASALPAPLTPVRSTSDAPRILLRMEDYFVTTPFLGTTQFNHHRPAR